MLGRPNILYFKTTPPPPPAKKKHRVDGQVFLQIESGYYQQQFPQLHVVGWTSLKLLIFGWCILYVKLYGNLRPILRGMFCPFVLFLVEVLHLKTFCCCRK